MFTPTENDNMGLSFFLVREFNFHYKEKYLRNVLFVIKKVDCELNKNPLFLP